MYRLIGAFLYLSLWSVCWAQAMVPVPEGFVLQRLEETDGQIAKPKDWFYLRRGTPTGWVWILSKEDPELGPFQTGMLIQVLVGVEKGTGGTREAFAQKVLASKRSSAQVVGGCPKVDQGMFFRECVEVIESVQRPEKSGIYRTRYSSFWGKEMDIVVFSTFSAPNDAWAEAGPIADVMANFVLIGPNFGKSK